MSSLGSVGSNNGNVVLADGEPLDLRNRALAAVLAWLIPGAGHYYQRRYLKAAIFFFAIMSTFGLGMLVAVFPASRCRVTRHASPLSVAAHSLRPKSHSGRFYGPPCIGCHPFSMEFRD
jgi:hypothetical protein